jgi:hypothetical protein
MKGAVRVRPVHDGRAPRPQFLGEVSGKQLDATATGGNGRVRFVLAGAMGRKAGPRRAVAIDPAHAAVCNPAPPPQEKTQNARNSVKVILSSTASKRAGLALSGERKGSTLRVKPAVWKNAGISGEECFMYSNNRNENRAAWARGFMALCAVLAMGLAFIARPAEAAPFAYVANEGSSTVSVIDTITTPPIRDGHGRGGD